MDYTISYEDAVGLNFSKIEFGVRSIKHQIPHHSFIFFGLIVLFCGHAALAQKSPEKQLYQLSGLVLNQLDQTPVPYASVVVAGSFRGTAADGNGFFSLVVVAGDTIDFSAVGYKSRSWFVSDTMQDYLRSIAIFLIPDTVELDPLLVNSWPAFNEFRDAFINLPTDSSELQISSWGGFHRVDNPIEPEPTIFNPASLFYEKVIVNLRKKKRKRKKSKELPKFE